MKTVKNASDKIGNVYFLADEGHAIKVGFAENVDRRICGIGTSTHRELLLIGSLVGTRRDERRVHEMLWDYHIRREWFADCVEVRGVIDAILADGIPPQEDRPEDIQVTDETHQAIKWARNLVREEVRGAGDFLEAARRAARKYNISYAIMWSLLYRPPRDIGASVYFKLKNAQITHSALVRAAASLAGKDD
jgi:hypothetical protein